MRWRSQTGRPAPAPQPPPASHSTQDTSDVEFLIGQTSEWIRSADNKTGLLLAGLTVLLGAVSSSARDLRTLWSGHHSDRLIALIMLAASVVLLAVAYALLVAVLVPRRTSLLDTRFAWPWVHTKSVAELEALQAASKRVEAWRQAKQLAAIAARKHGLFTWSVWISAFSVACFLAWSLLRH